MSKWKKKVLTFAIAIILVLFVGFGIEAFYDSPDRSDFCDDINNRMINTKESCEENNGTWNSFDESRKVALRGDQLICTKGVESDTGEFNLNCKNQEQATFDNGYCDNYKCYEEYDSVRDSYNRDVFIICAVIGLIVIFVGGIKLNKESVGSGVLAGGILTVIYGTIRYWEGLGEIMRFILLGLILGLLIWIGYKKIKD